MGQSRMRPAIKRVQHVFLHGFLLQVMVSQSVR